ncbi:MFS transporter [Halomonadaceae bacterium KBTZ08]
MNATEKRAITALAMVYGSRMLGLFMILPVFVLLGRDLQGASPTLLGVALGAYGLSQALLQIPFGMLSDRFGRKPLIQLGLLLFAAGSLLAGWSDSIHGVIAGRILQGSGAIASVLMALASDLTREENRTKGMATIGLSIGLAFALSLVLGPMVGEAYGLTGIFLLTAVLAGIGMVFVATIVPSPEIRSHQPDALPARDQLRQVLTSGRLLRLDAGIFVLHMALTAIFLIVPLTLEDLGLATSQHWWVYLSVMGAGFVAMLPLLIIGEKKRRLKQVMSVAVALLGVAVALMGVGWQRVAGFWAVLFVFFMGFNLLEALLPSLISKEAPAAGKGSAMGVYSTSQFMGSFVGGTLGGWLSGFAGASGVIVLVLLGVAVWLLLVLTMAPPRYATSLALRLNEQHQQDPRAMREAFMAIPGVDDAVVLAASSEAWLKVDRQYFSEEALWRLPFVARQA